MKTISKIMSLCLAATLASSVLSGCSSSKTTGSDSKGTVDTSKPVELSMYLIGSPARDYDQVLAELNKKAKADLNATVKVSWIGWGDFSTKYPLVLASGEPIDLIYTATWLNFYQQAQKGAFKALEEIGPKYAPKSFAAEPKEALKQATIDGHIYALPANFNNYNTYGVMVRGDLMKKYGITDIKTIDDYGKYLDAVTKNDKNLDPAGMYNTQTPIDGLYFFSQNLYPLTGDVATNSPFWIDVNDPSGKIVNIVDRPDMPDFLKKMKEWSDKGYWPKSVLSNKDNEMLNTGKAASLMHNMDTWVGNYIRNPQYDLKYYNFVSPSYPLSYIQDAMAIPASSQNPERALMLLEKLRTDQSYYNLLTYGIEGKHYEITADKKIKALDSEGFQAEGYCSWGFRDSNFRYEQVGSPSNLSEFKAQLKSSGKTNIYTSFNMNLDPVKNEYAAVLNVMQQYYLPLKLGYVDPVSGLATLKEKLKAAGVEKVQAELQKQLDEFIKNNK
ncbi:extracellular solute-binding protein [Clostridium sp. SYSU_GA19001]|uniref:DUF3502 domain-containing protein n=1 Tax=Clostridium caldaquaticum TaxID=2940653 RepID=UPI0020774B14|nr:DUF3502 domain-containing protein [Clostridium caldaquaticum]MCM8710039.1 extracellular solute-binding protein [Clostridium caldaquaticum]